MSIYNFIASSNSMKNNYKITYNAALINNNLIFPQYFYTKNTYGMTAASKIAGWVSNKASSSAGGTCSIKNQENSMRLTIFISIIE